MPVAQFCSSNLPHSFLLRRLLDRSLARSLVRPRSKVVTRRWQKGFSRRRRRRRRRRQRRCGRRHRHHRAAAAAAAAAAGVFDRSFC